MAYALQFQATDTLAATLNSGATTTTLTTGNFGSPSGTQLYVVDYDIPGSAEIISATVSSTSVTSITRGLTGGAAGTTNHAVGAKIGAFFVPQHYDRVANRTLGYTEITSTFTTTATPAETDVTSLAVTVTVPSGGARIRISSYCGAFRTSASSGTSLQWIIKEGATDLDYATVVTTGTNYTPIASSYITTATAGSHTYKIAVAQSAAGTIQIPAAAQQKAYILVEVIE